LFDSHGVAAIRRVIEVPDVKLGPNSPAGRTVPAPGKARDPPLIVHSGQSVGRAASGE